MNRFWAHPTTKTFGWIGGVLLVVAFFVLAALAAAIITFSTYYPKDNPLNLTPLIPKAQGYLAGMGLHVTTGHMDTYYDNGTIVLRAEDLRVYGADGTLAIVVNRIALDLARRRLFAGIPAPKHLLADGVTFRLIRTPDGIQLAGLNLTDNQSNAEGPNLGGFVEWLNGLDITLRWGALEKAEATDVTLLLRDDVQQAEWAMEEGSMGFQRTDDGERSSLTATLRRLYGGKALPTMPVMAVFDHAQGAENATLRARFDKSDVGMVADYFPPQIQSMFKAKGRVELGVLLTEGNKLGQPWVTLNLTDVAMKLPKGYSAPLMFPQFNVTATYQPTPTDVMTISNLEATTRNKVVLKGRGVIKGLATLAPVPPESEVEPSASPANALITTSPTEAMPNVSSRLLMDLTFQSVGGNVKDLYELAPDKDKAFAKTLAWMKPNILEGKFTNLVVHYNGSPSDFPACGDACGVTVTAGIVPGGRVKYLDNLPAATLTDGGTFVLAGETLSIKAPTATSSAQNATDVAVAITELFSPSVDTVIDVRANLAGPLDDMVREVGKIEKPIPLTADGSHATTLRVVLPLKRGKPTTLDDATITAKTQLANATLSRFDNLTNTSFFASKATFALEGNTMAFQGDGTLNGEPMKLSWQDAWRPAGTKAMSLKAVGRVPANWLTTNFMKGSDITLTGTLAADATLTERGDTMEIDLTANGREAGINVPMLNWTKPTGQALTLAAKGSVNTTKGELTKASFGTLRLNGTGVNVNGNLTYIPNNFADTRVALDTFKLGRTDGKLTWDGRTLELAGNAFDFTALETPKPDGTPQPDMAARLNVGTMYLPKGLLTQVKANVQRRSNVWELGDITALAEGSTVRVEEIPLPGQTGRRKLRFNIANLGTLLAITDVYSLLKNGILEGELTYDTPTVAGGVLTLRKFELDNPPLLAKLLGLLSLQQLFSGTDTLLFDKAIIPVRLEGPAVYLDKMIMDGPALSLRLDGVYYRNVESMDMYGSLTPAIPMNRIVSKIPLLGTLLTGSQDGLVVADFKMKGNASDPKIDVRPLSVLTPGLLKDIFRGGDAPKPKPRVESSPR
ncbi:MAG: DUF3971 domain-containing protein [Alphaproteobacteria bacterium]